MPCSGNHPETYQTAQFEKKTDFGRARHRAEKLAASKLSDPMLVAWFDGKKAKNIPMSRSVNINPAGSPMPKAMEGVCA